ncbi:MAG TPA: VTT domain-containing protein [Acidimicrobiia bacterium]|nr:VTT domain-containing protein [Acidimicrobiia bacterium]
MENFLAGLDPIVIYMVVGGLAFGESVSFLSFFLPGEVALVTAAALAGPVGTDPVVLGGVAVVAAAAGGWCGYELGRRYGPGLMKWRPIAGRVDERLAHLDRALQRGSGIAVVIAGRFNQFTRALVPAVAGIARMPRHRFMWANLAGAIAWGVGFTLIGHVAAEWWRNTSGTAHVLMAVVMASIAGAWWASGRARNVERPRD